MLQTIGVSKRLPVPCAWMSGSQTRLSAFFMLICNGTMLQPWNTISNTNAVWCWTQRMRLWKGLFILLRHKVTVTFLWCFMPLYKLYDLTLRVRTVSLAHDNKSSRELFLRNQLTELQTNAPSFLGARSYIRSLKMKSCLTWCTYTTAGFRLSPRRQKTLN